jgi:hypothetical protein
VDCVGKYPLSWRELSPDRLLVKNQKSVKQIAIRPIGTIKVQNPTKIKQQGSCLSQIAYLYRKSGQAKTNAWMIDTAISGGFPWKMQPWVVLKGRKGSLSRVWFDILGAR